MQHSPECMQKNVAYSKVAEHTRVSKMKTLNIFMS